MSNKGTGTLRLTRETLSAISCMRAALSSLYGKDMDADQTIEMMVKAVAASNPPLWEKFREIEFRKRRMESSEIVRSIIQNSIKHDVSV